MNWRFATAAAPTCPCSLWTLSTTPGANCNEAAVLELGVKFRSDNAGYITGLRFYEYSQNSGPHTGSLWSVTGTLLGTGAFTSESASGWQ